MVENLNPGSAAMPYRIDVWGGDLHQRHIGTKHFDDWNKVADFIWSKDE